MALRVQQVCGARQEANGCLGGGLQGDGMSDAIAALRGPALNLLWMRKCAQGVIPGSLEARSCRAATAATRHATQASWRLLFVDGLGDCKPCSQPCGARRLHCSHTCQAGAPCPYSACLCEAPCHPGILCEDTPCRWRVKQSCPCGQRVEERSCGAFSGLRRPQFAALRPCLGSLGCPARAQAVHRPVTDPHPAWKALPWG